MILLLCHADPAHPGAQRWADPVQAGVQPSYHRERIDTLATGSGGSG